MKIFSIVNIKGGVGKTVSTVNIAACLQEQGKRILMVDLDQQGNCSQTFKAYSIDDLSVSDVLIEKDIDIKCVIKHTDYENLDILPSNLTLAFTERKILLDTTRQQQNRLKKALKSVENDYDYCIIDCPPALNIITINALVASSFVIVPIKIDQFALDGLGHLIDSIEEIKEEFNPDLQFRGCFVTMDCATTVNKTVKVALGDLLGDKLLKTSIKNNSKVVESTFEQKPVIFSSKKATASKNYRELVKELF